MLSAIAAVAADTDRHGVPRRGFDAMAAAGLLGSPLTPPALQDRWLEPVACGQALAGVAFAHLRRAGAPNPLDGRLDWITSWDIADLVLLCLRCVDGTELADGQVLFVEDFSIWSDACGRPASCWCRPKRLMRAGHPFCQSEGPPLVPLALSIARDQRGSILRKASDLRTRLVHLDVSGHLCGSASNLACVHDEKSHRL